jgi:PPOX class probable F420-dependent enzyme
MNVDGTIQIVPIVFAYAAGRIYFPIDQKPKTTTTKLRRLENISKNPHVTLLIDDYSEDWRKLSYVLIYAVARLLSTSQKEEKRLALKLLKKKYPQYQDNHLLPPTSPVVSMRIGRIVTWSAKSAPKSSLK